MFCEVKTRSGERFRLAVRGGDPGQAAQAAAAGDAVAVGAPVKGFPPMRFDVIGVLWRPGEQPRIEHRAEAF